MTAAEQALRYWPQLRDAVQPVAIPRRNGEWHFRHADEWSALAQQVERGEFRLRLPASSSAGLAGPFRGVGSCLDPVLLDGDLTWIDPTTPACDGDFVLVRWHPEKLRGIVERGSRDPAWLAMYGREPADIATKWLRRLGNDYLTACNESTMPLDSSPTWGGADRILGIVRYVERNGVPLYGCGPLPASHIAPGAATETLSVTDVGPLTTSLVGPATNIVDQVLTVTVTTEASDVVLVTASYRVGVTGSSFTVKTAAIRELVGVGTTFVPTMEKTTTAYEPQTVVGTFTQAAGTYNFGVGVQIDGAGTNVDAIFRDLNIQVVRVRR